MLLSKLDFTPNFERAEEKLEDIFVQIALQSKGQIELVKTCKKDLTESYQEDASKLEELGRSTGERLLATEKGLAKTIFSRQKIKNEEDLESFINIEANNNDKKLYSSLKEIHKFLQKGNSVTDQIHEICKADGFDFLRKALPDIGNRIIAALKFTFGKSKDEIKVISFINQNIFEILDIFNKHYLYGSSALTPSNQKKGEDIYQLMHTVLESIEEFWRIEKQAAEQIHDIKENLREQLVNSNPYYQQEGIRVQNAKSATIEAIQAVEKINIRKEVKDQVSRAISLILDIDNEKLQAIEYNDQDDEDDQIYYPISPNQKQPQTALLNQYPRFKQSIHAIKDRAIEDTSQLLFQIEILKEELQTIRASGYKSGKVGEIDWCLIKDLELEIMSLEIQIQGISDPEELNKKRADKNNPLSFCREIPKITENDFKIIKRSNPDPIKIFFPKIGPRITSILKKTTPALNLPRLLANFSNKSFEILDIYRNGYGISTNSLPIASSIERGRKIISHIQKLLKAAEDKTKERIQTYINLDAMIAKLEEVVFYIQKESSSLIPLQNIQIRETLDEILIDFEEEAEIMNQDIANLIRMEIIRFYRG